MSTGYFLSACFPFCLFVCFLSFCLFAVFLGSSHGIWRFPGWGSNQSCSRRPTTEPQQRGIWAVSATHSTAHGNTGSLIHWARPGMEPATPWFLVGFVNHWATTGTPTLFTFSSDSIAKLENQKYSTSNSAALSKVSHEVTIDKLIEKWAQIWVLVWVPLLTSFVNKSKSLNLCEPQIPYL